MRASAARPDAARSALPAAALAALTLLAAALRLHGLGAQLLGDDETHLLTVVTSTPLRAIPGTVIGYDFSIPMACLMRAWSAFTPLDEWMLRTPTLLAGCLTPALAAVVLRRFVSPALALATGLALAVHPMFIFYSRYVRPYAICAALLLVVLWMLDRWAAAHRARSLAAAACAAALAAWFQPLALLPAALLLLALLALELRSRPAGRPLAVVLAGAGALALTLACYAPSLLRSIDRSVAAKVGLGRIDGTAARSNLAVLAGVPGSLAAAVFVALVIAGAALLARRLGTRSLLLLLPAFGQPAAILLLRPAGLEDSQVLARYLFYALPLLLLFAVAALGAAARLVAARLPARLASLATGARGATCGALLLASAWLAFGPYRDIYGSGSSFAHHNVFQTFRYRESPHYAAALGGTQPSPVHPYYDTLAAEGDRVSLVVEWPATLEWPLNYDYLRQARHHRPVKLLAERDQPWYVGPRLALQNVLDLDARADWRLPAGAVVVLHRNPMVEQYHFMLGQPVDHPPAPRLREAFAPTRAALAGLLGPPVFEDEFLTVFRAGAG